MDNLVKYFLARRSFVLDAPFAKIPNDPYICYAASFVQLFRNLPETSRLLEVLDGAPLTGERTLFFKLICMKSLGGMEATQLHALALELFADQPGMVYYDAGDFFDRWFTKLFGDGPSDSLLLDVSYGEWMTEQACHACNFVVPQARRQWAIGLRAWEEKEGGGGVILAPKTSILSLIRSALTSQPSVRQSGVAHHAQCSTEGPVHISERSHIVGAGSPLLFITIDFAISGIYRPRTIVHAPLLRLPSDSTPVHYQLSGFILYNGTQDGMSGHYLACCRRQDATWWMVDGERSALASDQHFPWKLSGFVVTFLLYARISEEAYNTSMEA